MRLDCSHVFPYRCWQISRSSARCLSSSLSLSQLLSWYSLRITSCSSHAGVCARARLGSTRARADTVGINVYRMRYANVIIGGLIAGLAGAYFTIESVPSFEPLLTNGRGFISLAALIFGNWTPFGAWAASLLFGAAQALQINMQFFRAQIPPQWAFLQMSYVVGMLPYVLTMIILTGVVGKTTPPAADGIPYEK